MAVATWTNDRETLLRKLWDAGYTASSIAGQLGGVTRCAVIGKVHRLGLSGRQIAARMSGQRYSRVRPPRKPRPRIIPEEVVAQARARKAAMTAEGKLRYEIQSKPDIPAPKPRTIATIEPGDCRWPYGDPQEKDFHFCGGAQVPGLPYCEYHCRRAFQPPDPRRLTVSLAANSYFVPGIGRQSTKVLDEVKEFLETV